MWIFLNTVITYRYQLREPDRGNLDDPTILWREGKPDYTLANYTFLKEKSQNHSQGVMNYRNTPKNLCKNDSINPKS